MMAVVLISFLDKTFFPTLDQETYSMDETAHASTVNVSSKETDQYVQTALVQVRYRQGEVVALQQRSGMFARFPFFHSTSTAMSSCLVNVTSLPKYSRSDTFDEDI